MRRSSAIARVCAPPLFDVEGRLMCHFWRPLTVLLGLLLAAPAWAQDAVHWHNDLESAKTVARESKRLVLIHFWTTSCVPCKALEQNVFSQPGVASAIETQFVPVKLNADENPATAQSFGITRVPTDVIITPDGQVIGKLVSPTTPAAYVAEVSGFANKYATNTGALYAGAVSSAPAQSQLRHSTVPTPDCRYRQILLPSCHPPYRPDQDHRISRRFRDQHHPLLR